MQLEIKQNWEHTRLSQAFLGISFRSFRRSFCSLSKRSLPMGPTASASIGLSLNELQRNKELIDDIYRFNNIYLQNDIE